MRDLDQPSDAVHAAWRIVEAFREPFVFIGAEMFATASVGVAVASVDSKADDLVREADTALYVAKDEGRDRVSVFNEDLRAEVTARLTIEGELRHALERGQLEVWYQPEVELATGRVTAVEALLRWRHPDGSIRPAGQFIEVAEETGLILHIGEWVLQQACADAVRWAAEVSTGPPVTVRVNVSALQLAEPSLLDVFDDALAVTGAAPSQLCIEITETALLRETAATRDNLAGIRSRGLQIAADDFGTGYASLAYLLHYPIDVLKIDRSFVEDISTSDQSQRLVAGIISLADALGMRVTAEGVETADQAAVLRSLHCPGAQGYLYSRAVPADQISALLRTPFDVAQSESDRRARTH
jgi:EAL domain-containing protein (putative c-di-GMP-specific phosphodiesterase class I)